MDAQSVIDSVSRTLIDEGTVRRWTELELLSYLNEGIRSIVTHKPSANITHEYFNTAVGSKQDAPTGCIFVQDVPNNAGPQGSPAIGRSISLTNRHALNETTPDWPTTTATTAAHSWMYDSAIDPKVFYLYPPSDGTYAVEIVYSAIPTELTDVTDTVPLDDMYVNPMMEYMLFRSFEKDSDNPDARIRATAHYQLFSTMTGIKLSTEFVNNPMVIADPELKRRA